MRRSQCDLSCTALEHVVCIVHYLGVACDESAALESPSWPVRQRAHRNDEAGFDWELDGVAEAPSYSCSKRKLRRSSASRRVKNSRSLAQYCVRTAGWVRDWAALKSKRTCG
jgi:hypothetical protein